MLFNSINFLFFFPIVLALYFSLSGKYRWILLLFASYFFYASWKLEYIFLIIFSTCIDYYLAIKISQSKEGEVKKKYLILSIATNLGVLFGFKYFNFFSEELQSLLNNYNVFYDSPSFKLLLPVGISFYTFQTLSYSIDVFKGRIKPEKHLGFFALYVSFFPQLVAGPIERPGHLLPQLKRTHRFTYANFSEGTKLVIWGYFKKVVIADRVSEYVNIIYDNPDHYQGLPVLIGTILFAFQIFCDFSGYTDIARGVSKMMGYDLMQNFNRPYSAKSIREFWSKWHISLSTWFRDYLYIPMGGNRVSKLRNYCNILITFIISGLWHGSNWTFLLWGTLHGFYLLLEIAIKYLKGYFPCFSSQKDSLASQALSQLLTFGLICFAWIFFRANNIHDAFSIIDNLFQPTTQSIFVTSKTNLVLSIVFITFMELTHRIIKKKSINEVFANNPSWLKSVFFALLLCLIFFFGVYEKQEFIYFQF